MIQLDSLSSTVANSLDVTLRREAGKKKPLIMSVVKFKIVFFSCKAEFKIVFLASQSSQFCILYFVFLYFVFFLQVRVANPAEVRIRIGAEDCSEMGKAS